MPRPLKPIGELGTVSFAKDGTTYVARARVRLADGSTARPSGKGTTKAKAEADLRAKVKRLIEKHDEIADPDPQLHRVVDAWLQTFDRKTYTPSTAALYRKHAAFIREAAGGLRLSECTTPRLERILFGPSAPMPSQAKGRKTVLGKIFTYAIREGLIAASPVPPIELIPHHSKLRDEDGEPIVFEPEQVHRLLELAKTFDEQGRGKYGPNRNLRVYPLLAVALGMGLRTGEILGLRWKNFDPRDNTLSIEKSVTYLIDTGKRIEKAPKTKGSRRILPMPKWVADALVAYGMTLDARTHHRDAFIFPGRDGAALRSTSLYRTLSTMLEGTEFEGKQILRVARHTVGTMITEQMGVSAAAAYLGHSKTSTTYANYAARSRRRTDATGALAALDPATGEPQSEGSAAGVSWD